MLRGSCGRRGTVLKERCYEETREPGEKCKKKNKVDDVIGVENKM